MGGMICCTECGELFYPVYFNAHECIPRRREQVAAAAAPVAVVSVASPSPGPSRELLGEWLARVVLGAAPEPWQLDVLAHGDGRIKLCPRRVGGVA